MHNREKKVWKREVSPEVSHLGGIPKRGNKVNGRKKTHEMIQESFLKFKTL